MKRALEEHASVASFARHALELLSLGAPLELLQAVTRAQADEVRHAALCLARAAAQGCMATLGPLDTDVPLRSSAFDVAMGVALEGCVNETLAAAECCTRAETARGTDREVLATIAEDEISHAALAWRTLRWLWPQLDRPEQRRIRTAMLRATSEEAATDMHGWIQALVR